MKLNFKGRREKGITLIALVITIIVLLILAGVTIATLTGDNGVLTKAEKAKDETEESDAIERVKIEVAGSFENDGKIDVDELNENLKNIEGLTYKGNALSDSNKITLPATVTVNGYDIQITSNGGVRKYDPLAEIIANPTAYYGKKVTNYKEDGNTYRIFYVDKNNDFGDGVNTIYLKADFSKENYSLSNYASYDVKNTKVREMNPLWAEQRGSSESSWEIGEKGAAYLCSPVNSDNYTTTMSLPWSGYYNSENANYVIGGPSVDMYVKSYNQAYASITDSSVYTLGITYRTRIYPGYIYTLNGDKSTLSEGSDYSTGKNSLKYTQYNSMYCGQNGTNTGYWWLASPSSSGDRYICNVHGVYACLSNCNYGITSSVSPLISLKSSFIPEVEE